MAQLPVYHSQGGINIDTPNNVRPLDTYAQGSQLLAKTGNMISELAEQWQNSKDEVENLDAKNKLQSGITSILEEANNYNDYKTPAELQAKQDELTQRMNGLTNDIMGGFSNNKKAREFKSNADLAIQQNNIKLQGLFRSKYGDLYSSNLEISANEALKGFTLTGNEAYKNQYFDAIETGVKAGYIDHGTATKLKLSTDDWNYDYVYSQLLNNPYFKASDEVMSKISPTKQRTLQNFRKSQIKSAQADALNNALNTFYLNPTQDNLNAVYKLNPKLKGSKQLLGMLTEPDNFETISNFEGYNEALGTIKDLAELPTNSYNDKMEYIKQAGEIAYKISKSNVDKSGNATLNKNDKDKLFKTLFDKMSNVSFKEELKNLPDLSNLKNIELTNKMTEYQTFEWNSPDFQSKNMDNQIALSKFRAENSLWNKAGISFKLDDVKKRTAEEVLTYASQGDLKSAQKAYEQGLQKALKVKYWYIPELQNENLQVGQKFTVGGKVYTFQGFGSKDIIVEVN